MIGEPPIVYCANPPQELINILRRRAKEISKELASQNTPQPRLEIVHTNLPEDNTEPIAILGSTYLDDDSQ